MLKLIVFDCDGVMFNSKKANIMYYNSLLTHFSLPEMSTDEEDYVHMSSVMDAVKYIFRHHSSPTLEQVHEYRKETQYGPFLKYMEIESDLREFLDTVITKYHLAISTNRTNTMIPLLQSYKLESYFRKVVTAATATRPKPAPDGLLEILDFFKCKADEAIFIGDSIVDEEHAKSCGVQLIAFKSPELRSDYHVENFMDILKLPPFTGQA